MAPPKTKPASFTLARETVLPGKTCVDAAPVIFSTDPAQNGRVYELMTILSDYKHVRNEDVHVAALDTFGDGGEEIVPADDAHPANACRCWFTFTETIPMLLGLVTQKVHVRADITIPFAAPGAVPTTSVYRALVHHEPGEKGQPVEVRRVRRMRDTDTGVRVTEQMTIWVGWYLHWFTKPFGQRSLDDTVDGLVRLFES